MQKVGRRMNLQDYSPFGAGYRKKKKTTEKLDELSLEVHFATTVRLLKLSLILLTLINVANLC